VARNFVRRLGELDIVARQDELLVIAEVRTRASDRFGGAAASIGRAKQRRVIAAAAMFLQRHPELGRCRARFDVLIVRDGRVEWIRHAFE
jgi:putative endonuclease